MLQDKFGQAVESQAILQQELMVYSQGTATNLTKMMGDEGSGARYAKGGS